MWLRQEEILAEFFWLAEFGRFPIAREPASRNQYSSSFFRVRR